MSVYLQSTTEENLYICAVEELWGSKTNRLSHWQHGDTLIVYVDRKLAALFAVTSEQFYDETLCWPEDIYPYRVSIQLEKIIHPADRYSISNSDTREVLFKHHTSAYGVVVVLGAKPLDPEPAQLLLSYIEAAPAWDNLDPETMLMELRQEQEEEQEAAIEEVVIAPSEEEYTEYGYTHTQIQYYLARLGQSLGFDVWIPKGDQGRTYNDTALNTISMDELPSLPFNNYVVKIIQNIDVIWLLNESPTHLFEVERTTSIYSGLLRMSDLATLLPMLNIQMYICSSDDRKNKVFAEVKRPTFNREPLRLASRCRFISFEGLGEFMEARSDILTFLRVDIIKELSEPIS